MIIDDRCDNINTAVGVAKETEREISTNHVFITSANCGSPPSILVALSWRTTSPKHSPAGEDAAK